MNEVLAEPDFLNRLQQGDQYAWDMLIQTYHSRLVVFAARQVPRNEAEDVVQAFWVKLQNKICSLNFLNTNYLYKGVTFEIWDFRRNQARRRDNVPFSTLGGKNEDGESRAYDPADPADESQLDFLSKKENKKYVRDAIENAGLLPEEKVATRLQYGVDIEPKEIAEILNSSLSAVQANLSKAKDKIQAYSEKIRAELKILEDEQRSKAEIEGKTNRTILEDFELAELSSEEIIVAIFYFGVCIDTNYIAEILECPQNTVNSRLRNARKKIMRYIFVEYGLDEFR